MKDNKIVHKKYFFWFNFLGIMSVIFAINVIKYRHDLVSVVIFITLSILSGIGSFFSYQKAITK